MQPDRQPLGRRGQVIKDPPSTRSRHSLPRLGRRGQSRRALENRQARPSERRGQPLHEPGGVMTRYLLPSRQGVFNFSTIWPAALHCIPSLAGAGRVK
jgi:hypothetical protein